MKNFLRKISAFAILACFGIVCLAGCGEGDKKDPSDVKVADNTEYYDAVTKTLKLGKSYEGKNFYSDGIGSAKVASYTDGDTTLFRLDNADPTLGGTVNIRYYSIDTPESTGGVEKWGKSASLFVKQQLSEATEIVLEATTVPASKDSYGTRYLGYVWYKSADYSEFKCLNLEIVENGYSENKAINTAAYPYYKSFKEANDFARSVKLRLYSELDDPLFSTDPIDTTIREFNENKATFYNEELESGSLIRFTAYLKSVSLSSSLTYTFVAEQYDAETGETHTLNVYTGYNSSPASSMKVGHLYQIVGNVQKYNGTYQISGITYSALYPEPDNTHVVQSNYYWTFDSSVAYTDNNSATLYSDVTVTSVQVEGTVMTVEGRAQKRKKESFADATDFTFKVNVAEGYSPNLTVGSKFSANAYKFDKSEDIWTVVSVNDIVKK